MTRSSQRQRANGGVVATRSGFQQLPPELLGHIFSFVSVQDKAEVRSMVHLAQATGCA